MKFSISHFLLILLLGMSCCSSDSEKELNTMEEDDVTETTEGVVRVTDVTVTEQDGEYTFRVTISSPDLGCNQYANWWEVIDLDGNLLYRRILGHSHVNEQPFTRSGGPVTILENTEVYVRAHMNTTGYGSTVFKGSVANGFSSDNLDAEFAKGLKEVAPLPSGCAF